MKKANLLSKAEMKRVLGGTEMVPDGGCHSDSDCGASEECCPDDASLTNGWKCQRHSYASLPDGSIVPQFCGGIFIDV